MIGSLYFRDFGFGLLRHSQLKVTQINHVSRNQLHNTANDSNFELWLELAWLGEKCNDKTLLVIEIFLIMHKYCTVTV